MTENTSAGMSSTVRIPVKFAKRDGRTDDFNPSKIRNGILKAFSDGNVKLDGDTADDMVDSVMASVGELGKRKVRADDVSRIVSRLLMERNPDAAEAYLTYREERTRTRTLESELQKQLKECHEYDEKLAHLALSRIELDLDDGVKKNYRKIQTASDGKFYEVLADSKNIMAKE